MNTEFLPTTRAEMKRRGWDECDIVLISGDAYVDHPAFGVSVIGRVLEAHGYRVGVIAQPDWRSTADFVKLGRPRLFFGISAGNVDSMLANLTANKRRRSEDGYSPGGQAGKRPDRAVIVYANRVREAFRDAVIVLGGIEASLRRLAHYDYWSGKVRRSVLLDSRADILVYGMGETAVVEIARRLAAGESADQLDGIRGTTVVRSCTMGIKWKEIPSYEAVSTDKTAIADAFKASHEAMEPAADMTLVQRHGNRCVIQFPPALPLTQKQIDEVYDLPYARDCHPMYGKHGNISGLETVKFSITSHRGCSGQCSFCALYFHQGRIVQSRSEASILRETRRVAELPSFKGTITDIGGPTANMYGTHCRRWEKHQFCSDRMCLVPERCSRFELGYRRCLELYRKMRKLPGVKHVFIGSGLRYDLLTGPAAEKYFREVCEHHVSGLLKVAPEHCSPSVLRLMNKPPLETYEKFFSRFRRIKKSLKKQLFVVNYIISSHPGASLSEALELGLYLVRNGIAPEQVQDFTPSPMTLATCMYHTGRDPFTGEPVHVAATLRERKLQRALIQYNQPGNRRRLIEALKELGAMERLPEFTRAAARRDRRSRKRRKKRR